MLLEVFLAPLPSLDSVLRKNAHIIYSAKDTFLDAENGRLLRPCWLGRLCYKVLDLFTCGWASRARRERVRDTMVNTLTKINVHLLDFKSWLEKQNGQIDKEAACSQLVTYSTKRNVTKTEPFAQLLPRISQISDLPSSYLRGDLGTRALEIHATIQDIKAFAHSVGIHDTPVKVINCVAEF